MKKAPGSQPAGFFAHHSLLIPVMAAATHGH
jgi:hypothetical protein